MKINSIFNMQLSKNTFKGGLNNIVNEIAQNRLISEEKFDEFMATVPKGKNGKINKKLLDSSDLEVFKYFEYRIEYEFADDFQFSVKNLKKFFSHCITKESSETINGRQVFVKRNLSGKLVSLNSGDTNPQDTSSALGMYKSHIIKPIDESQNEIEVYARVVNGFYKTHEQFFIWNNKTNSMDFYHE